MRARVGGILNRWPAVGLAVGVVGDGSLGFFSGHGLADIASNTPVTEDTVFRIGSVTKTFTAIAVMQLWEQGLVDLDAPANDYLRAYELIPARTTHRPATVRHLLTHTSGIPEVVYPSRILGPVFGEMVKLGRPVPSLADHYRGGIRLAAEPGTRYTSSDDGFATLGQIVEDVSGTPFDRYLRGRIFEPLGMADTDLLRSDRVKARLATGYELGSRGAKAAPDDGVGVFAFTNGARLAMLWLPGEVAGLLRHALGVPDEVIRTDVPHHPEVWREICGWYRLAGRLTDARARLAIGAGAEVFVRGGRLMLRGLNPVPVVYKGFPLHPDDDNDPYAFRMDLSEFGLGTARVLFSRDPGGGISEVHIDSFLPSLEKRSAATNPRRWVNAALALTMTAIAVRRHRRRHKGVWT